MPHLLSGAIVHLTLLTGVAIFLFPFAWMIGTSLRMDEELTAPGLLPALPIYRPQSPYARKPIEAVRPQHVSTAQWGATLPGIREAARMAVQPHCDGAYRDSAASVLLQRITQRMGTSAWSGSQAQALGAFNQLVTPDAIDSAISEATAQVEIYDLQLRTLDAHILKIDADPTVESGDASLTNARLSYRISDQPIILRFDFAFPMNPRLMHKLILSLKPDDSWHRVTATLDIGNQRWSASEPTYFAQHRPMSIILQPPSFEDQTYKPKTWITLNPQPPAGSAVPATPGPATLRLYLHPSSTPRAIYGKVQRNYARAFKAVPFWRYVGNSVLLVALTTIGTLFSSTFVAYGFARLNWPGRSIAFLLLLATMMLPAQVTMIPSFLIWRQLGWYNTLNPLWVPAFLGSAFFIFLMVQHMRTIPRELEESARLDGATALQTWYYIILPQVKPAAAAIAIMTFMGAWNEFMGPLIYLRDQSKFPLSLGLFGLRLEHMNDWSMIMAANVLMTLPVIVIFFLCQRYFVQGMMMSGLKA